MKGSSSLIVFALVVATLFATSVAVGEEERPWRK
jgi:hypothetical protein